VQTSHLARRPAPTTRLLVRLAPLSCMALPHAALAQAIERNPAPAIQPDPTWPVPPVEIDPAADATPLGVTLHGITLLAGDAVAAPDDSGIRLKGIEDAPWLADRLRRFIGRPLSQREISAIKAAIAKAYRDHGRPFVHVSAPEQEISSGQLTLRVERFRLGEARISGVGGGEPAHVSATIRQRPDVRIDA
jgi:hemolysin activation/secretion protein